MATPRSILELISSNKVYYEFRCDDRRGVRDRIPTDRSFRLTEMDELNDLLVSCNAKHLNYDLIIQEWNSSTQSVETEIYIVNNNHLNS